MYNVKASEKKEENLIDNENLGKLMKYDAVTDTTTEVNMDEIKEILNSKSNYKSSNDSLYCEGYSSQGTMSNIFNHTQSLSLVDNLQRVPNVNVFPYTAICKIQHSKGTGSGVLVGKNVLLTAAHVVYDEDNNNQKFEGWLAKSGFSNHSFKDKSGWSQVYYYDNWMQTHNWQADLAICILNDPIGDGCYMGFQNLGDSLLNSLPGVTSVGYPKERESAMHPYYSKGKVKSTSNYYFTTDCYCTEGLSGGPMINDETGFVLGINQGRDMLNTSQRTMRITSDVFNLLSSLR